MKKQIDTVYALYLNEVKNYRLLTAEEEKALLEKIDAGDEDARKRFINSNLRLVISIAGRFADSNIPFMDLIQEGNIGLMTALSKFKTSFHTRFSTYAYPWILQYMQRYVHTKSTDIYIPDNKIDLFRKVNEARSELFAKNGFVPSDGDIARVLNVEEKVVRDITVMPWNVVSLDAPCSEYDEAAFGDSIPDTSAGPEETAIGRILKQEVRAFIDTLPKEEGSVMCCRYDFDGMGQRTLFETSELLGVSSETVRKAEIRALRFIKENASAFGEAEEETLTA
ncbi:RNA polymerase sigma factor RpoD/SigA [Treponema sp. Marseille-Q4523]|uniref:sigma-70 family RNA polymerase sigma factor n=1 Tax=Treponema sp. Marseille-Q4523 TaxID=2810610 RepID=UPI00195F46A5|nr:sigma-70 family RNA polymerase sigma factor [Treponema sp. Marseille-Q4523]MBM7023516.1 sigma-70 family RNA polymerase sigma factor [Treponema sp. Marseille-Q4523]